MIACLDVSYKDTQATTALVLFENWHSTAASDTYIHRTTVQADYVPGSFYKRELPCLLATLKLAPSMPKTILVDGYAWLNNDAKAPAPGLGAHLFQALEEQIPVIGVAKSRYKTAGGGVGVEVLRGNSSQPLIITAAGMDSKSAAEHIKNMHGKFRLPAMIQLADSLARVS